jgi:hypothetical protein
MVEAEPHSSSEWSDIKSGDEVSQGAFPLPEDSAELKLKKEKQNII